MAHPLILIPARMQATRLPGKPLADIHGEPMIVHVWRRAVESGAGDVAVATDAPEIAAAMKAGGLGTRWPRPKTQRRAMPSGKHPGMHIASMTERGRKPFVEVCLVGGALYLDVMQHFVDLFQEDGFVTGSAPVTEICAPIGIMRQQMRIWLNGSSRDAVGDAGAGAGAGGRR